MKLEFHLNTSDESSASQAQRTNGNFPESSVLNDPRFQNHLMGLKALAEQQQQQQQQQHHAYPGYVQGQSPMYNFPAGYAGVPPEMLASRQAGYQIPGFPGLTTDTRTLQAYLPAHLLEPRGPAMTNAFASAAVSHSLQQEQIRALHQQYQQALSMQSSVAPHMLNPQSFAGLVGGADRQVGLPTTERDEHDANFISPASSAYEALLAAAAARRWMEQMQQAQHASGVAQSESPRRSEAGPPIPSLASQLPTSTSTPLPTSQLPYPSSWIAQLARRAMERINSDAHTQREGDPHQSNSQASAAQKSVQTNVEAGLQNPKEEAPASLSPSYEMALKRALRGEALSVSELDSLRQFVQNASSTLNKDKDQQDSKIESEKSTEIKQENLNPSSNEAAPTKTVRFANDVPEEHPPAKRVCPEQSLLLALKRAEQLKQVGAQSSSEVNSPHWATGAAVSLLHPVGSSGNSREDEGVDTMPENAGLQSSSKPQEETPATSEAMVIAQDSREQEHQPSNTSVKIEKDSTSELPVQSSPGQTSLEASASRTQAAEQLLLMFEEPPRATPTAELPASQRVLVKQEEGSLDPPPQPSSETPDDNQNSSCSTTHSVEPALSIRLQDPTNELSTSSTDDTPKGDAQPTKDLVKSENSSDPPLATPHLPGIYPGQYIGPDAFMGLNRVPPVNARRVVIIWDLDETLIIFKSLLSCSYNRINPVPNMPQMLDNANRDEEGKQLGLKMEEIINTVLKLCFFHSQIREVDQPHIHTLSAYDDGRTLEPGDFQRETNFSPEDISNPETDADNLRELAYRYRLIRMLYESGSYTENPNGPLFLGEDPDLARNVTKLLFDIERFTGGWLYGTQRALAMLSTSPFLSVHHILVTEDHLTCTLVKLMIYGLDQFFQVDHIYSTAKKSSKQEIFKTVQQVYKSRDAHVVGVGDGEEEKAACSSLAIPFIEVANINDIYCLYEKVIRAIQDDASLQPSSLTPKTEEN